MEQYWQWICTNLPGDPAFLHRLLEIYQTPEQVFLVEPEQLLKRFPRQQEKLRFLCESRKHWDPEKERERLKQKEIRIISCEHPEFPERLKQIPVFPCGLFFKGMLPEEQILSVAIVGARNCSSYGKNMALWFGKKMAEQGVQIISGMARGIDGYGHRGALQAGGKTFAVLGGGVDLCYPSGNRDIYMCLEEKGGILSENPPGMQPLPYLFPLRNRIISGLSDAVLIIEAKEKSGSLITADFALEQGKEIYAVPGRIGDVLSSGCHNLIRQGAGLAVSPEKLLEDLCFLPEINTNKGQKSKMTLERPENLVYSCVGLQALSLEEICSQTKLLPAEVLKILTKLELSGCIKEVYKNYYTRVLE